MAGLSHTVSGDIASFRTPSRVPIESLKFHFLPKQADGTPSPVNPIPIDGWTRVNGNNINGVVPNISNNNGMEKSGNIWRNTSLDSKTKFDAYIQLFKNSTYIKNAGYKSITDSGVYSITFNVDDSNCNRIVLIHSGSQTNLGIKFDFNLPLGTYTISFKAISVNPSISGGLSLSDIFIIAGENVESEVFPITFPDGQTIYGGYVDPVSGEIVAEYEMIADAWKNWVVRGTALGNKIKFHRFNNLVNSVNGGGGICISNVAKKMWKDTEESSPHFYITHNTSEVPDYNNVHMFLPEDLDEDTVIQVLATLVTPIHIPIASQDLRAFLDHNNFWSDANDITEVTYAVTESKDILATRKKTMDFDNAHHKKVKWNNMAGAMNSDYWQRYNELSTSVLYENGEATLTVERTSTQRYIVSLYTKNNPYVYEDHRYYMSYMILSSYDNAGFGAEFAKDIYVDFPNISSNVWTRFSAASKAGGTGMGRIYMPYFKNGTYQVGDYAKLKNVYYVDLTLMFGAGNEPTKAEFEHICEINGIDLTTYQPYDEGSDRWLIIP